MSTEGTPNPAAPAAAPAAAPETTTAPPTTPAAPAAPAAAPSDEGKSTIQYEPTGNPSLDIALNFFGSHGIDSEDPAFASALQGDFATLKATMAAKGIQGADQMIAIVEGAWKTEVDSRAKAMAEVDTMLDEVSGGQWETISAWINDNATDEERKILATAIDGGGLLGRIVAEHAVGLFRGASGTTLEPKDALGRNAPTHAGAAAGGPLSPDEYRKATADLTRRGGTAAEQEVLDRRRMAWRG